MAPRFRPLLRRSLLWRRLRASRGQAVVELALLLPVLLLLTLGVVDFARAYNVMQVVTNSAREGARAAIIPTSTSAGVISTVTTYLTAAGQAGCTTTGANWGTAASAGATTTVTVACPFAALTGTLIPFWTGTFNLTQTVTMRHE